MSLGLEYCLMNHRYHKKLDFHACIASNWYGVRMNLQHVLHPFGYVCLFHLVLSHYWLHLFYSTGDPLKNEKQSISFFLDTKQAKNYSISNRIIYLVNNIYRKYSKQLI